MATEKAERLKGAWSPFSQMQWYRKRCNKLHKAYQASKFKKSLKMKATKSTVTPTTTTPTKTTFKPDLLRLY